MKAMLVSFLALIFFAGMVFAQAEKTHDVTAEVIETDATAKTITLETDGKEMTVPVEGDAVAQLSTVEAGDTVTVTCRDDASGAHKAITKITKQAT